MKLGVFSAMMVEGSPFDGKGRKLPPGECLTMIKAVGYSGVEWGISKGYGFTIAMAEKEAEHWGRETRAAGLEITGVSSGAAVDHPEEVRQMLEIAARLPAPMLRVSLLLPKVEVAYGDLFTRNTDLFGKALDLARPFRIKLVIETHFGFMCASASQAHRFLSQFRAAESGAIHDAGNMVIEGRENWKPSFELLGAYLAHVHVKNTCWRWTREDWLGQPTDQEHWQWQFCPLAEGLVDWAEVVEALQAVGYRGWLSMEDFSSQPLDRKLNEDRAFLARVVGDGEAAKRIP